MLLLLQCQTLYAATYMTSRVAAAAAAPIRAAPRLRLAAELPRLEVVALVTVLVVIAVEGEKGASASGIFEEWCT
jgi:hypothetical protein